MNLKNLLNNRENKVWTALAKAVLGCPSEVYIYIDFEKEINNIDEIDDLISISFNQYQEKKTRKNIGVLVCWMLLKKTS